MKKKSSDRRVYTRTRIILIYLYSGGELPLRSAQFFPPLANVYHLLAYMCGVVSRVFAGESEALCCCCRRRRRIYSVTRVYSMRYVSYIHNYNTSCFGGFVLLFLSTRLSYLYGLRIRGRDLFFLYTPDVRDFYLNLHLVDL